MVNFLQRFLARLRELFSSPAPPGPVGQLPEPVIRRVLQIVFDPRLPSHPNQRLSSFLGWTPVDSLIQGYIQDLQTSSHGYLQYRVIEKIAVDGFPAKKDGFSYTVDEYLTWKLSLFPHFAGRSQGIAWNWWQYVSDP